MREQYGGFRVTGAAIDRFVCNFALRMVAEGRVVLPEALKTHAGIKDAVAFVGLGNKFQTWEPNRFRSELAEATEQVRPLKQQLGIQREAPKGQGARE